MLLRRITEHVKVQNWFAVAIDFSIVVVGVFVGIQVSNWNDARAEGQQEKEILANILDDIRSDVVVLASGIQMAETNIQAANYTLLRAGLEPVTLIRLATENVSVSEMTMVALAPEELEEDETRRLWSDLVVRYHPTQSATAFDTLMATGRLGIIKDHGLVQQLQAYQQKWAGVEVSQNTTYRPFRNQTVFVGQKSGLSPFIQMPEEEFIVLVKQDKELSGALRTMLEYAIIHRYQLDLTLAQARALLIRLGEEEEL